THHGIACRFMESEIRDMGRTAQGVRGIRLSKNDYVVSMVVVRRNDAQLLIIGENGYGKRTALNEFRLTKRGAKGVIAMNLTVKTGKVVGMMTVLDNQDLIVITTKGILIRQNIRDIRTIGRNTQGVKLIRLDSGDQISDFTIVNEDEDI